MTSTKMRGLVFSILAVSGFAAALSIPSLRLLGLAFGIIFCFLGATAFSQATQIANSLRQFVKSSVRIEVWGLTLPPSSGAAFEIDSVSALGVGLLIHLRATSGGPSALLKVAQPGALTFGAGRIEIGEAAYVSWAGTKLRPVPGQKLPALAILL